MTILGMLLVGAVVFQLVFEWFLPLYYSEIFKMRFYVSDI